MTPAGHLLSGYLAGEWLARGKRERLSTLGAALFGSIAPDFDVALGLIGGWAGASAHRGASHSLLGAVVLSGIAGALARQWVAFAACLAGVLTHIFWDSLNFWGVQLLWPARWYVRGDLVHEGDLYALGTMVVAAVLVWKNKRRAALVWLLAVLPLYVAVQLWWRSHARELAARELSGRRTLASPAGQIRCGWIVLSAGESDLSVHCVSSPVAAHLTKLFSTQIRSDFFTRASQRSASVREFLDKNPF